LTGHDDELDDGLGVSNRRVSPERLTSGARETGGSAAGQARPPGQHAARLIACYLGTCSPERRRATAVLAALWLASSAIAYLFLVNALAWTVYLFGPFLLLWIAATGIWLTAIAGRPAVHAAGSPPGRRR
jgi:hypothetical protein